jgi:hypothetical protein
MAIVVPEGAICEAIVGHAALVNNLRTLHGGMSNKMTKREIDEAPLNASPFYEAKFSLPSARWVNLRARILGNLVGIRVKNEL